jgi:hypothetical protein
MALEPSPILTVNLHSYSQLWMYPYGYGYFEYPENVEEIVSTYDWLKMWSVFTRLLF